MVFWTNYDQLTILWHFRYRWLSYISVLKIDYPYIWIMLIWCIFYRKQSLCKIPKFGRFARNTAEPCVLKKFSQQEIRWNYDILCSELSGMFLRNDNESKNPFNKLRHFGNSGTSENMAFRELRVFVHLGYLGLLGYWGHVVF